MGYRMVSLESGQLDRGSEKATKASIRPRKRAQEKRKNIKHKKRPRDFSPPSSLLSICVCCVGCVLSSHNLPRELSASLCSLAREIAILMVTDFYSSIPSLLSRFSALPSHRRYMRLWQSSFASFLLRALIVLRLRFTFFFLICSFRCWRMPFRHRPTDGVWLDLSYISSSQETINSWEVFFFLLLIRSWKFFKGSLSFIW